jgi:hypothetical protein
MAKQLEKENRQLYVKAHSRREAKVKPWERPRQHVSWPGFESNIFQVRSGSCNTQPRCDVEKWSKVCDYVECSENSVVSTPYTICRPILNAIRDRLRKVNCEKREGEVSAKFGTLTPLQTPQNGQLSSETQMCVWPEHSYVAWLWYQKNSQPTPWRHRGKTQLHSSLTSALGGGDGQFHAPAALSPRKNPLPIEYEAERGAHRAGLYVLDKRSLVPAGILTPDRPARSLVTTPTTLSLLLLWLGGQL